MSEPDLGAVLDALSKESRILVDRALSEFLDTDFLEYDVLDGRLTKGHVMTQLAREGDRMADELLAASGRVVPPVDRGRRWEIGEGGELRPGAVLIDDLHVAVERLAEALDGIPDWRALPAEVVAIPSRRLLQLVVHHHDLGRPWSELDGATAVVAVAALPTVLAEALAATELHVDESTSGPQVSTGGGRRTVTGPSRAILAWATGRPLPDSPSDDPHRDVRVWI